MLLLVVEQGAGRGAEELSSFAPSPRRPVASARPAPGADGCLPLRRARGLKRHGRAVLLWAVVLYAVAQLGLDVVMDRWCPWLANAVWRDKWPQVQQLVAATSDRPLVVMLGSSRTDDGFQAGRLCGRPAPDGRPLQAYNFGVPMTGPAHQGLFLDKLLAAGIRPRLLLVELLPPLLNEPHRRGVSEENWTFAATERLNELVRLWPYFDHPGRKAQDWLEGRVAPAYAYRRELTTRLLQLLVPRRAPLPITRYGDHWGYRLQGPLTPPLRAYRLAESRATFPPALRYFRIGARPRQALRHLLERCRRENIPVALVLMPESSEFRGWYTADGRQAIRALLDDLRQDYGIDVIDATEWIADQHFVDTHHLLPTGSELFTTRLIGEIDRLLGKTG
jgi:hypothetical protein